MEYIQIVQKKPSPRSHKMDFEKKTRGVTLHTGPTCCRKVLELELNLPLNKSPLYRAKLLSARPSTPRILWTINETTKDACSFRHVDFYIVFRFKL